MPLSPLWNNGIFRMHTSQSTSFLYVQTEILEEQERKKMVSCPQLFFHFIVKSTYFV